MISGGALEKQKGLTLIEVLLAWGMLALFLSTAMWAQVEFLQKNRVYREKMIAQWQVAEMAERMLANKSPEARNREFHLWDAENKVLLPHSKSEFYCVETVCEIRLSWGQGQPIHLWV